MQWSKGSTELSSFLSITVAFLSNLISTYNILLCRPIKNGKKWAFNSSVFVSLTPALTLSIYAKRKVTYYITQYFMLWKCSCINIDKVRDISDSGGTKNKATRSWKVKASESICAQVVHQCKSEVKIQYYTILSSPGYWDHWQDV